MARTIYANSKIDRNAFSVGSFDEPSDEKNYWLARTPSDRLKQIEILRRINYGHRATVRLQRVFKIASGKPELFLQKNKIIRMGHPPMCPEISTGISGVEFEECYASRIRDIKPLN